MFGFLKKKELKANEDTKLFFACYKAEQRPPVKLRKEPGKSQADKFRERYKGIDPFAKTDRAVATQHTPKQSKGKLNSTKKQSKTIHSLQDLEDVFCS